MTSQPIVPFEIGITLKELGYAAPCGGVYDNKGKLTIFRTHAIWNKLPDDISAPPTSDVVRWLREDKGVEIGVRRKENLTDFTAIVFDSNIGAFWPLHLTCNSYDAAELATIQKCLTILKENVK